MRDISLEVASPGINRTIKSEREYAVFTGRHIRVLREDDTEWLEGTLKGCSGDSIALKTPEGVIELALSRIKKAKLVN